MDNLKTFTQSVAKMTKKCIIYELKLVFGTDIKTIKVSYRIDKNNKVDWTVKFFNNLYMDKGLLELTIKEYAGDDLKSNLDNIFKIYPTFKNYVIDYYNIICNN